MKRGDLAARSSSRHRLPRIGPCRDPLRLWFLEYRDDRGVWRRYYADRNEARQALRAMKAAIARLASGAWKLKDSGS